MTPIDGNLQVAVTLPLSAWEVVKAGIMSLAMPMNTTLPIAQSMEQQVLASITAVREANEAEVAELQAQQKAAAERLADEQCKKEPGPADAGGDPTMLVPNGAAEDMSAS